MNDDRLTKLLAVVGVVLVLGVVGFIFRSPANTSGQKVTLTVWGTVPELTLREAFIKYKELAAENTLVEYVYKDPTTLSRDLIQALAAGTGPDIWMTDELRIQNERNFIASPANDIMSVRTFTSSYIDAATQAYVLKNNEDKEVVSAIPVWADPLVLYWNKTLFNRRAIATPPKNWTELQKNAQSLTEIRSGDAISVSGIAMGRAKNIPEYRDILTLLLAQYGAALYGNNGEVEFGKQRVTNSGTVDPTYGAFRYYTDFGNSGLSSYSWNTQFAMPMAEFQQGRLAMMVAPASSVESLRQKNPHLIFDIAAVPQLEGSTRAITASHIPALVVNKASTKQSESWKMLAWLASPVGQPYVLKERSVAPINRALIGTYNHPEFGSLLSASALQSVHLVDNNPDLSSQVMYDAVESITDRRATISEAVRIGTQRLIEGLRVQ